MNIPKETLRIKKPVAMTGLKMVGAERFELPTYCSQSNRATRLRYAPCWKARKYQ